LEKPGTGATRLFRWLVPVVLSAVVITALVGPARLNPKSAVQPASAKKSQRSQPVQTPSPSALEAPQIFELDPFDPLQSDINDMALRAGVSLSVSLRELSGPETLRTWSFAGSRQYSAASSYKLPLLMAQAEQLAAGRIHTSDTLCFQAGDYEPGWYDDYGAGSCFSRQQLAYRVGKASDNTAAHMLVRSIGGADGLNAYAGARGAASSQFFIPNLTTTEDLATLMQTEAAGKAGGQRAQQWLYPLLTGTLFEDGIPAGVRGSASTVHKVAAIDLVQGDVALVRGGGVEYVLVVFENGLADQAGWNLIASVSQRVWQLESARVNSSNVAKPTTSEMPARRLVP
jgi:hypothetical protein